MTEPEYAEDENEVQAEAQRDNYAAPLIHVDPESASTNFYWTFGKSENFNLQTTLRGNLTAAEIAAHFQTAIEGMKQVLANGGHAKVVGWQAREVSTAIIPNPATPAQAAVETGKASPTPAPQPATKPAATTTGQKQALTLVAAKVSIEPQPDGRTKVSFYEAGHKFPDIYSVKPPAIWATMLGWDAGEFAKLQTFENLAINVAYTLSDKLNSKGNPYKDIFNISH